MTAPTAPATSQSLVLSDHLSRKVLEEFLEWLKANHCTYATLRNYKSDIQQYLIFYFAHHVKFDFSQPRLSEFAQFQSEKNLKDSSVKRKLSSITSFLTWAKQNPEIIQKYLLKEVAIKQTDTLIANQISQNKPLLAAAPPPVSVNQAKPAKKLWIPNWIYPYLAFLSLLLFFVGLGVFGYFQLISNVVKPLAFPSSPTAPNRILSFQGRLTDTAQNPIITATNFQFSLYNHLTNGSYTDAASSTGPLLWKGTCTITPDQDGIFTANLGDGTCGSSIDDYVFSENANTWLEARVGTETLTPRQPVRTVAYALNAQTLQGYPISATEGATVNTVLTMNSSGDLVLGENSPEIKSSSGTFTIEGATLKLQTSGNGDITLDPGGVGGANILSDLSLTGYLSAPGATLSATYAGGVPLTVQGGPSGTGNLLDLETSAGAVLGYIDASGNFTLNAQNDLRLADSDSSNYLALQAPSTVSSNITYTLPGTVTNGYVMQTDGSGTLSWADPAVLVGASTYWDQAVTGVIYPKNSTVDLLVGGTASSAAKFAFLNVNAGTPTASISGSTSGNALYLTGDGTIATTLNRSLALNPSGGNVGIGTANPNTKLDIVSSNVGATFNALTLHNSGSGANTLADQIFKINSTEYGRISAGYDTERFFSLKLDSSADSLRFYTNGSELMRLTDGGNVGIGTTNPLNALEVNSASPNIWLEHSANAAAGLVLKQTSANASPRIFLVDSNDETTANAIYRSASNYLVFGYGADPGGSSGSVGMIMNDTGRVGIGTTAPGAKLDINGDLFAPIATLSANYAESVPLTVKGGPSGTGNLTSWLNNAGSVLAFFNSSGDLNLNAQGDLRLADSDSSAYVALQAPATVASSITYTLPGTITDGYVLSTNATGELSWVVNGGSSVNWWRENLGAISPINNTVDLLLGSDATESAKFGFINVGTGTPTASISAGVAGATYLTADGVLATTAMQTLTLGNSTTTGNIVLNPFGNIGIGQTSPLSKLHLTGAITGKALAIFDELGDQDIFTASAGGNTRFRIDNDGYTYSQRYVDMANSSYYLDPAATDTSLTVVGKTGIGVSAPVHQLQVDAAITGKALTVLNETGDQDVLSASVSGLTKVTISNEGYLGVGSDPVGPIDAGISFPYQKSITITNSGSAQINYEALIEIDTSTLISAGKMQGDCDDMRFADADGVTPLEYWLESGCDTTTTQVWVRIPSVPNGDKTIYLHYGNPTAPGDSLPWSGTNTILARTDTCPVGSTRVSALDSRIPRGATTYGGTGGQNTSHSHTISGTTGNSNGYSNGGSWSYWNGALAHTHTFSLTSSATAEHVPPYIETVFCAYSSIPNTLDTYDVGMFTSLPTGWTSVAAFDKRVPMGATSYGTTGGYEQHRHTWAGNTNNTLAGSTGVQGGSTSVITSSHGHGMSGTTGWTKNDPSFYTLDFASRDASGRLSSGTVAMFDNPILPPLGWTRFSDLDSRLASASATTQQSGGSTTHTHSFSGNTSGWANYTTTNTNYCCNGLYMGDVHAYSGNSQTATSMPAYMDVIFAQKKADGTSESVGAEVAIPYAEPNVTINTSGNVGMGIRDANWRLQVKDDQTATASAMIENTANLTNYNPTALILRLGNDATNPDSGDRYINFMRGDSTIVGKIQGNGAGNVAYTTAGIDFAEYFLKEDASETIETGDLVCHGSNHGGATKCTADNTAILGVVSANPGFLGGINHENDPDYVLVGLVGQVPVKINGNVRGGDALTVSNLPGYAQVATSAGTIVGRALETSAPSPERPTINARINVSWYDPNLYVTSSGDLNITETTPDNFEIRQNNILIQKIESFSEVITANLKAGLAQIQKLVVKDQIETPVLKTDLISPLNSNSITFQLGPTASDSAQTAQCQIKNAESQTVASIDEQGNTSLLGNLMVAQDASIAGEIVAKSARLETLEAQTAQLESVKAQTAELMSATISGTLYADSIFGLDQKVKDALQEPTLLSTILGQAPEASAEAVLSPLFKITDQVSLDATGAASLNRDVADLALADDEVNLGASAAFINQYLEVNGDTFISGNLGVNQKLLIGQGTQIADGVINYLDPNQPSETLLQIQPSGQGSLSLLAGLMTLDDSGQVTITGNLEVAGDLTVKSTLMTNLLQPAKLDQPLQIQLSQTASDSGQVVRSRLEFTDEIGQPVATVSASGRAEFARGINTGKQTSGKATILASQTQAVINSDLITDQSLIYFTPLGSTNNQVLYVINQQPGEVIVGLDQPLAQDLNFNWWVVN